MALAYRPLARSKNLVSQPIDSEVLVYNTVSGTVVRLNDSAARVWRAADGTRDVAQIAATLGVETKAAVSEDIVWLALELLENEGLLESGVAEAAPRKTISRRELGMRLGAAALVLLPLATSLAVPSAAQVGGSLAPVACQSCVVLSSGVTTPCTTVSDGNGGTVDCSSYVGDCLNGNSCNAGGTPVTTTCTACASQVFGGGGQNNAWHVVLPV